MAYRRYLAGTSEDGSRGTPIATSTTWPGRAEPKRRGRSTGRV